MKIGSKNDQKKLHTQHSLLVMVYSNPPLERECNTVFMFGV